MLAGCAAGEPQQYTSLQRRTRGASLADRSIRRRRRVGFHRAMGGNLDQPRCMPLQPDATRCNAVVKITLPDVSAGLNADRPLHLRDRHDGLPRFQQQRHDRRRQGARGQRGFARDDARRIELSVQRQASQNGQNKLTGTYFCMQGGGYIEQGRFQVERSY